LWIKINIFPFNSFPYICFWVRCNFSIDKFSIEYLEKLFGPGVHEAIKVLEAEMEKRKNGEESGGCVF
jgi:hypothetical protein